jgi:hypothetical protein
MSISSFDIPVRIILSTPALTARSSVDEKSGGWYCLPLYLPWNSSAVAVTAILSCQLIAWCLSVPSTHISEPQASSWRSGCYCWKPSKIDILVCHAECCNYCRVEVRPERWPKWMYASQARGKDNRLREERTAHTPGGPSKRAVKVAVQNSQNVGVSVGLSQRGMVRVYPGLARQRWAVSSYGKHDGPPSVWVNIIPFSTLAF